MEDASDRGGGVYVVVRAAVEARGARVGLLEGGEVAGGDGSRAAKTCMACDATIYILFLISKMCALTNDI